MISEEVQVLLERMDTFPDEFIKEEWDPVLHHGWATEPFSGTRWGNLIATVFTTGNSFMFTEEDLEALKAKYTELIHKQTKEKILKELVSGERVKDLEFSEKQFDLPYMSQSTTLTALKGYGP